MNEIDITGQAMNHILNKEPLPLTGSVMQLGSNAAKFTWNNALEANDKYQYVNDDNVQYISNYFQEMGMELDDREQSDIKTINAILIQHIDLELKEHEIDNNDDTYNNDDYTPFFKHENKVYIQL